MAIDLGVAEGGHTKADYAGNLCVHQLVELQAEKTPHATAVVCNRRSLTYAELNRGANRLARYLRERGVSGETLVGLCVERSTEMVIALLAILKAGGACVPIDPAYPQERIYDVLQDSQVPLLITQKRLLGSLPQVSVESVYLDKVCAATRNMDPGNLMNLSAAGKLMYVIYTSGSTGKPKGVQIEHRSVVNFLTSMRQSSGLEARDVLVAVTTLSFDIAGLEMYLPLIVGARLVIADRATVHDGRKLLGLLENSSGTVMQSTPATWRLLIQSGWKGNGKLKIPCGGEALPAELARELFHRGASVWNLYGPAETTIWSSLYRVTGNEKGVVPIGRPIANTQLHVPNQELQHVPIGTEGVRYIGGDGLARGITEPVVGKLAPQLKICIDRIPSLWGVEKLPSGVGKESVPTTVVENWASGEVATAPEPASCPPTRSRLG